MTIRCQSGPSIPQLRTAWRNTGQRDINLVLGITLGNGSSYHASALLLDVRRRGGDKIEAFQLTDSHPDIAGRVDPWILPLPVASEFSLARPLNGFDLNLEKLSIDRAPM